MAGRGTDIKLGEGVADLGGLHVIGTERHESRRIDRQLRGRCSRQGDPGSSQFFISFEDDLMRNFGDSRRITGMMTRMGMEDDEGLQHPWLNRSVETAQKRVESLNYQRRKNTLQYDDVMNQQREVIYSYRNDVLIAEDPRNDVFELVRDGLDQECAARLSDPEADVDAFVRWINTAMPLNIKRDDIDWQKSPAEIAAVLFDRAKEAYELKIKFENPDAIKNLERYIVLNSIDRLWQEHLYAMDSMRTSIGLRAHGQKDPLIEYKQEAYGMFEELMENIKREILSNLFRSATSLSAFEQFLSALPQNMVKEIMPGMADMQAQREQASTNTPESAPKKAALPIRRQDEKIGRNDMVVIKRGEETQTMKWKKAEPMVNGGGWIYVKKAD